MPEEYVIDLEGLADEQLRKKQRDVVLTILRKSKQDLAKAEERYRIAKENYDDLLKQSVDDVCPLSQLTLEGERY